MTETINPERLRLLRKIRDISQKTLADNAGLTKKTISRLEQGNEPKPIRPANLERLARALEVDPEVLTGEKPMPADIVQSGASMDDPAYQLNVRVDAAVRNAFELVARRYNISVTKIAQLAPLLFVIAAEASLKHRQEKLDKFDAAYDHLCNLGPDFPHYRVENFWANELDTDVQTEKDSIHRRDVLGRARFSGGSKYNPFESYLTGLAAKYADDATISDVGPTSTEYRVCRSEAVALAGEEFADQILDGEVPIHRMPRDMFKRAAVEERVEWMHQNKISVQKVKEPDPISDAFSELVSGLALDLKL